MGIALLIDSGATQYHIHKIGRKITVTSTTYSTLHVRKAVSDIHRRAIALK